MVKVVRIKGVVVKADFEVSAPKKRWNLPCYDKSICQIDYCKITDRIVTCPQTLGQKMIGAEPRKEIHREPCGRDCKSRVNLRPVSARVCKDCVFVEAYEGIRRYHVPPRVECEKVVVEALREAERLRMPYGGDRRIFRRGGQDHWYGGHVV